MTPTMRDLWCAFVNTPRTSIDLPPYANHRASHRRTSTQPSRHHRTIRRHENEALRATAETRQLRTVGERLLVATAGIDGCRVRNPLVALDIAELRRR
ncbi:hypothetical protein U1Q18_043439 [Sarracenia purpurea var. burkii]